MKNFTARLMILCLVSACSLVSLSAMAAAPEFSTNLVDAKLGRVFMSDAQRQTLDRLRRTPIASTDVSPQPGENEVPVIKAVGKTPSSSGFIVPSNGLPYQWKDGEFRETTNGILRDKQSPVGITITRHEHAPLETSAHHEPLPDSTMNRPPAHRVEVQTNTSSKVTGDEQQ